MKVKKKAKKTRRKQVEIAQSSKPQRNTKGQLVHGWGRGSKQVKKKSKKEEAKKKPLRAKNGQLLPGQVLNPKGRGTGTTRLDALLVSISRVETKKDKAFLDMIVERAYEDDTPMAVAILNRLLPSLRAIEMLTIAADSTSNEEAEKIKREMLNRFGD